MPSDGEAPPPGPSPLQVGVVGGLAGTALTAVAWLALGGPDSDASDAVAAAGPSAGDAAAALLWAVSLFFASPSQSLLLFLGRVDAERPSDASLRWLGTALRLPVDEPSYEPPPALVAANGLLYAAAGVAVAAALNAGLGGEATWGVSTGLGSCAAAFVYEVGRPQRLSAGQQVALQSEWSDFRAFADARLARTGRCHTSDVERAYRLHSPAYRRRRAAAGGEGAANAANDSDLRKCEAGSEDEREKRRCTVNVAACACLRRARARFAVSLPTGTRGRSEHPPATSRACPCSRRALPTRPRRRRGYSRPQAPTPRRPAGDVLCLYLLCVCALEAGGSCCAPRREDDSDNKSTFTGS